MISTSETLCKNSQIYHIASVSGLYLEREEYWKWRTDVWEVFPMWGNISNVRLRRKDGKPLDVFPMYCHCCFSNVIPMMYFQCISNDVFPMWGWGGMMGSHLMCFHSSFTFTIRSNVCVINGSHHLVGLFTISKCSCHVSHPLTSNFLDVPNSQEFC